MKVQVTYDDTLYQLVPKEPTTAMIKAGAYLSGRPVYGEMEIKNIYSDMISAAPTPPAQPAEIKPQDWMPIETAPKDCPILVTNGKHIVVIKSGILIDDVPWADPVGFGGYEWDWDFEYAELTHWMPLPPPPESGIKGES